MKKVFVSFADKRMHRAAKRIAKQATDMGVYDRVVVADEDDLDPTFMAIYRSRMIPGSRGFGYWCWKPQIILQVLRTLEDGDILQWADVGCHLNPHGTGRLLQYFKLTETIEGDILAFQGKPPEPPLMYDGRFLPDISENVWTKGDLLDYFGVRAKPEISMSPQIGTTTFFIKKSASSVSLVQKWQDTYSAGFFYADDSPSVSPNIPGFIQHRHDQSIFSMICKTNGIQSVSAFEYWYPKVYDPGTDIATMVPDWEALRNFPVHARRDKDMGPLHRFIARVKEAVSRALGRTRTPVLK